METKHIIYIILLVYFAALVIPRSQGPAPAPATSTAAQVVNISTTTSTTMPTLLNFTQIEDKIRWINRTFNKTNIIEKVVFNYTVMDLTVVQQKALLNMNPKVCFTSGCSDGFDKCKRKALSIMELKGPKFRESFGSGYDPFLKENDSLAVFEIIDNAIDLNGTYWYITVPAVWQYINETVIRNGTFRVNRSNIRIRRIV